MLINQSLIRVLRSSSHVGIAGSNINITSSLTQTLRLAKKAQHPSSKKRRDNSRYHMNKE